MTHLTYINEAPLTLISNLILLLHPYINKVNALGRELLEINHMGSICQVPSASTSKCKESYPLYWVRVVSLFFQRVVSEDAYSKMCI
jgi:hypothetical protein